LGIAGTVEKSIFDKHDHSPSYLVPSLRGGFYTGMAIGGTGILLGLFFFIRSLLKEGWKLLDE